MIRRSSYLIVVCVLLWTGVPGWAQPATGAITGVVRDQTGSPLPGTMVTVLGPDGTIVTSAVADAEGRYRIDRLAQGRHVVEFRLPNFAMVRRPVTIEPAAVHEVDVGLQLTMSADVTVTGKRMFRNLADVERPEGGLIGVATASSEGLVTGARDRGAPDHARRRSARSRPRADHQPAQRRGQGEPVLPARLQPRSRHRLHDDRRRGAREHANPRPRPGLLGPQLPDSRTGQRCPVPQGPVLRRRRRFRDRRRGAHPLRQRGRTADRPGRRG